MRKKMSGKTGAKGVSAVGPTSPTRVVAYVRVSTEQQASEGNSLAAQKEKLRLYAELHGLELVATEVDAGVSASTLDRPGLQRALERLEVGECEALVVVKLDRLTRSVRDLCTLVDTYFADGRTRLMSVGDAVDTGSASGRLVLNVLMSVSQWEREAIGERTAAVMQHLKATGKFTGGFPPFGFYVDDEGKLVEHVEEQALIAEARVLRPGYPLRRVAELLVTNPRTGKPFTVMQIQRMLNNPVDTRVEEP